jgi:hypothetical protein
MEDILRLLRQEQELPCDWYGGVICGHVVGVLREGGFGAEVVAPVPALYHDDLQIDDYVTVATNSEEDERFWLARVLALNQGEEGDEVLVRWFASSHNKEFGCYRPEEGEDEGWATDLVSFASCRLCEVTPDERSSVAVRIVLDPYGGKKNAILVAMSHARQLEEQHDSQNNQAF